MNYKTIDLKTDGDFAVLTLNRPERLNSLDRTLLGEMLQARKAFDQAPGNSMAQQLSLEAEIQLKLCDDPVFIGGVMKFLKKSG